MEVPTHKCSRSKRHRDPDRGGKKSDNEVCITGPTSTSRLVQNRGGNVESTVLHTWRKIREQQARDDQKFPQAAQDGVRRISATVHYQNQESGKDTRVRRWENVWSQYHGENPRWPSKFDAFVAAWSNIDPKKQKLHVLSQRLIKEEIRISTKETEVSALAVTKPQGQIKGDRGHEKPAQQNQSKQKSKIVGSTVIEEDTTLGTVGRRDKVTEVNKRSNRSIHSPKLSWQRRRQFSEQTQLLRQMLPPVVRSWKSRKVTSLISGCPTAHSGLQRRKSDINLGFTRISNIKHFYIMAFESLTNLLQDAASLD